MTTNDGGPAFPLSHRYDLDPLTNGPKPGHNGMTLRDYFAAAALTGLIASSEASGCESTTEEGIERECREYADLLAKSSYRYADAMLKAREGGAK